MNWIFVTTADITVLYQEDAVLAEAVILLVKHHPSERTLSHSQLRPSLLKSDPYGEYSAHTKNDQSLTLRAAACTQHFDLKTRLLNDSSASSLICIPKRRSAFNATAFTVSIDCSLIHFSSCQRVCVCVWGGELTKHINNSD